MPISQATRVTPCAAARCDEPFIPISQAPHLNWLLEKGLCLHDLFHGGVPCARSALTVVAVCEKGVWASEGKEGSDYSVGTA